MPADPATIGFRPLARHDFALLEEWIGRSHVAEWWTDPVGADEIEATYGPTVDGTDPTRTFLILAGHRPVGFIQAYRLADEPDYQVAVGVEGAAGLDLFLGEADVMGEGFGTAVLRAFVAQVVWPTYPEVARAMAGPSIRNHRSQRALEKAGFARTQVVEVPGEEDPELVMVLERPDEAPATPPADLTAEPVC